MSYTSCGLNLVLAGGFFVTHSMQRDTDWIPAPAEGPSPVVEQFWREGRVAYRRDLHKQDPYGELRWMEDAFEEPIRCIIDIPFRRPALRYAGGVPHGAHRQGHGSPGPGDQTRRLHQQTLRP